MASGQPLSAATRSTNECPQALVQITLQHVEFNAPGLLDYWALLRGLLWLAMMKNTMLQPTQPQDAGALPRLQVRGLFQQVLPQNRN